MTSRGKLADARKPKPKPTPYIMILLAAGPDGRFLRLRTQGEESPNSAEQCAG
jgi:hypothetical protein